MFEIWHIWVIAGIVLLIAEIFTPGFVAACFSAGCFASALGSYLGAGAKTQITWFTVSTFIVFVGIRPLFMKYLHVDSEETRTNVDALVDRHGTVLETVDPESGPGRVKIGGEDWMAVSQDGSTLPKGTKVIVSKVEGAKVYVRAAEPGKE